VLCAVVLLYEKHALFVTETKKYLLQGAQRSQNMILHAAAEHYSQVTTYKKPLNSNWGEKGWNLRTVQAECKTQKVTWKHDHKI